MHNGILDEVGTPHPANDDWFIWPLIRHPFSPLCEGVSDTMSQNEGNSDEPTEESLEPTNKPALSPKSNFTPSPLPPLLLASQTLSASAYASFMYSIARITIFKFQISERFSPLSIGLAFGIPTAASLIMSFVTSLTTNPAPELAKTTTAYIDYKIGLRFWIPAAVVGVWTFVRRGLCEFAFCTSSLR